MAHKTQAPDVFSHNKKNTYSLSNNTKGTHQYLDSKCLVFCRPVPNSSSPLILITKILISRILGRITYSFMFLPLVIKSIGHDFVVFKCIDSRKVDDFDLFN